MGKEAFAGFDTFSYPGDSMMKSLWDHTNLYWCGFYLGPNYNWSPNYKIIANIGWGVAPIYMGKQVGNASLSSVPMNKKYSNGAQDGRTAVQYAGNAGIRAPTMIYFDVEKPQPDKGWLEYFAGWSRAVVNSAYGVGCYCGFQFAPWLVSALMQRPGFDTILPTIWAVNINKANPHGSIKKDAQGRQTPWQWLRPDYSEQHPRGSGYIGATSWQYSHGFGLEWDDNAIPVLTTKRRFFPVDMDTSIFRDPGNPALSFLSD